MTVNLNDRLQSLVHCYSIGSAPMPIPSDVADTISGITDFVRNYSVMQNTMASQSIEMQVEVKTQSILLAITALWKSGNTVDAIRLLRAHVDMTASDAKQVVDWLGCYGLKSKDNS